MWVTPASAPVNAGDENAETRRGSRGPRGRAAPRGSGPSSQWVPPLGVTGGLGQRVGEGGESLKTTQQAPRKAGGWRGTELRGSVRAFCSR